MMRSSDPVIDADLARAEAALERLRDPDHARFNTVRAAIRWAFRARSNLSEPIPDLVRRNARYQHVSVDGGKGSTIEDALVMVATIGQAMGMLHQVDGGGLKLRLLELAYRDGLSQTDMAKEMGRSQGWISTELASAEFYMLGWLQREGIVAQGGVKVRRAS